LHDWESLEEVDPRAARRERKLRKRRQGMRVTGKSVKLLEELSHARPRKMRRLRVKGDLAG